MFKKKGLQKSAVHFLVEMEPNCNSIEPRVTYGVSGSRDVMDFEDALEESSVCRQLFLSLYYERFKALVRMEMNGGVVTLRVPSSLSLAQPPNFEDPGDLKELEELQGEPQREELEGGEPQREEHKDLEDLEDLEDSARDQPLNLSDAQPPPNKYERQARALVGRVPYFSDDFQLQHLSTTLVLLGSMTGILGNIHPQHRGYNIEAYWTKFESSSDEVDLYMYVASRGLANLPMTKDLEAKVRRAPAPNTQEFGELTKDSKSVHNRQSDFWRKLTNAMTFDWLYTYAIEYMRTGDNNFVELHPVRQGLLFLQRPDVSKAMAARLPFKKNLTTEVARNRIYFLTHFVFIMSNYLQYPPALVEAVQPTHQRGTILTDEYAQIMHWLHSWHKQLTVTQARMRAECELLAEVGTCILMMVVILGWGPLDEVISSANIVLSRRADCLVAKPGKDCAFAVHQPGKVAEFQDFHSSLVLALEACFLALMLSEKPHLFTE
jgi:hypothetical protein